jgi:TPR repeat protein
MSAWRALTLFVALAGAAPILVPHAEAQRVDARPAERAISALTEDELWNMDGRDAAERVLQGSSATSLQAAANSGNMRAGWLLGHAHFFGLGGMSRNELEAARWWRIAADGGDPRGQNDFAWMLSNGRGVPQDYAQAARYYRLAANQNHMGAQNDLGLMYEEGLGVPQDSAEAFRLYTAAAENGSGLGFFNLARMYEGGFHVAADHNMALMLYRNAAERGAANAQEQVDRLSAAAPK